VDLTCSVYTSQARFAKAALHFDRVTAGSGAERTVFIANIEDPAPEWQILEVGASSSILDVEYVAIRGEIRCRLTDEARFGPVTEAIIIMVKDKEGVSRVEIPVRGQVVAPLIVSPDRVSFGTVRAGARIHARVTLHRSEWNGPVLLSPATTGGIELTQEQQKTGETICSVMLVAPEARGFFSGEAELTTNIAQQPLLRIPYSGFVCE
jgi:hypothetical protein